MRLFQVDAFTSQRFGGNPAAICLVDPGAGEVDAAWMQQVAAEMNLSETAFVARRPDGYGLRWFTPTVEVDLCGHATLAAAHALWAEAGESADELRFHTRSGWLSARRAVLAEGRPGIELDFPSWPVEPAPLVPGLAEVLGTSIQWLGRAGDSHLVELADPAAVRAVAPDFAALRRLPVEGVLVTAAGGEDSDFVSRYFHPNAGIDEDPVTGSAHCALAPYWAERFGRDQLVGRQLSARGGLVRVRLAGDRVVLGGEAVTVLRGELV